MSQNIVQTLGSILDQSTSLQNSVESLSDQMRTGEKSSRLSPGNEFASKEEIRAEVGYFCAKIQKNHRTTESKKSYLHMICPNKDCSFSVTASPNGSLKSNESFGGIWKIISSNLNHSCLSESTNQRSRQCALTTENMSDLCLNMVRNCPDTSAKNLLSKLKDSNPLLI